MYSNNLDKKPVANRFDELVTMYYAMHAQQENVQKIRPEVASSKIYRKYSSGQVLLGRLRRFL